MRKVAVLGSGLVVAGTAALMGAGVALSQPSVETSPYNVVGEQYGRARRHRVQHLQRAARAG